MENITKSRNSIFVINPYKRDDVWAFDDPQRGIYREAFVSGADTLLEQAALRTGIPASDFERGITVLFSAQAFPGEQFLVRWTRQDDQFNGNWYHSPDFNFEGWLCPTLLDYFEKPPAEIHFQIRRRT